MDCQKVKELSIAHILGELEPKSWESLALKFHLQSCLTCAEQYENYKQTIGFIEVHKAEFAEAFESLEVKETWRLRIEHSWQSIKAKLDRTGINERKAGYRRIIGRLTAAAACLVIGAIVCLFVLDSKPRTGQNPKLQASALALSIRIEVLEDGGGIIVPPGELIESSDALKTLIINNKHRLVMDAKTALSIRPLGTVELTGCIVNLASGRIYADIEYDGHPFVVKTTYGRAVITGTIFDIEATKDKTNLIVAKGAVQFVSQAGSVEVKAGNQSAITANSAPSTPQMCDAEKLTAWAKMPEQKMLLAKVDSVKSDNRLEELGPDFVPLPIELEKIGYDRWVEQNQEWFEHEFPQIFELQVALTNENVTADYPELLIVSGDFKKFVYPPVSSRQLLIPDYNSLLKAAAHYGFDEKWLTNSIRRMKPNSMSNILTGQEAFDVWIDCFRRLVQSRKEAGGNLLLNSLHAAVYLENTRTLAWLCIVKGITDIPEKERSEILDILQTEVKAAAKLKGNIFGLLTAYSVKPCDEDEYMKILDEVILNIGEIKDIEERILGYEADK